MRRRMRGSRKRHIHPLSGWDIRNANNVRLDWIGLSVDDSDCVVLLSALMTFTVQYAQTREADLAIIVACFLRRAPIYGFTRELRQRWFQTAMMNALIPHLIGHPSTAPHPPHLSDVAPQ